MCIRDSLTTPTAPDPGRPSAADGSAASDSGRASGADGSAASDPGLSLIHIFQCRARAPAPPPRGAGRGTAPALRGRPPPAEGGWRARARHGREGRLSLIHI
ncbi:hypothetical protein [Streptomyces fragilis]|uniref:hypothetical protein n=1 Tax=Streptomyces fragilis TaxID=67301 RepID=UPI0024DEDF7D|nr:hypothetical protein [Streptomyces fragilis]